MKPLFSTLPASARGFTLIELSIALIIIGLIVGGTLAGRSLIGSAGARATIAQIDRYNAATDAFQEKYLALPGDIGSARALKFGFAARGIYAGEGDGNNLIEGVNANASGQNYGVSQGTGETAMFWVDLSRDGTLDATFTAASATLVPSGAITASSTPNLDAYMPVAKTGKLNHIYVYSWSGINYYGISGVTGITGGALSSQPLLKVTVAYEIDKKIDDGLPDQGMVRAQYVNGGTSPAGMGSTTGTTNAAIAATTSSCFDNGNTTGPYAYSMTVNAGSGANCGLSFQFQ